MATSRSSSSRSGSNGRKSTSTSRSGTKRSTSSRSSSASRSRSGTSSRSRTGGSQHRQNQPKPIRREIGAVVCLLLAVFSGLNYFSIDAVFINFLGKLLKGLFGYGFWFIPPAFLLAAGILMFHRGRPVKKRLICTFLLPFLLGGLIHLLAVEEKYGLAQIPLLWKKGQEMCCGGAISGWFSVLFSTVFSKIGAAILYLLALFVCNMFITKITPADIVDGLRTAFSAMREYLHSRPGYAEEDYFGSDDEEERPSRLRRVAKAEDDWEEEEAEPEAPPAPRRPPVPKRTKRTDIDIPLDESEPEEEPSGVKFDPRSTVRPPHELLDEEEREEKAPFDAPKEPEAPAPTPEPEAKPEAGEKEAPVSASATVTTISEAAAAVAAKRPAPEPAVPVSEQQKKSDAAVAAAKARQGVDSVTYQYPPVYLLDKASSVSNADAANELQTTKELLDDTLQSFGIDARIVNVTRGPSVTRYELELMRGVKLNKLTNLAGDIALSLGAPSVRIAPIPGRNSVVGIEVPNQLVTAVPIRDVIDSREFRTHVSKVAFAVGKDISGKNIVGNIAKLPHMLIAGTTGSGKSVCTNSLIISLLYKSSPEDVRLIMVDPKMVELGIYNGIPHLLIPVVTDPKKAAGALQWAVNEMMKRYRAFSEVGVRDLASYNAHMIQSGEDKLPQIVVVIDELADLMLVAAKEVEESICRVAQMGRAAGMHLIIATQRPSSDVITGLMKANIPSRIAFAVASSLESRIILDTVGAEKLVGKGDMLYAPLGIGKPQRVQGCMITDEEVAKVVEFIKENCTANYDDSVMDEVEANAKAAGTKNGKGGTEPAGGAKASSADSASEMDELLPQAVEIVVDTGMASVSMLQRRLKLGYSRAARLVDQMEELKVVGPFEGSKPRQVLITKEQWAQRKHEFLGGDEPSDSGIQAEEFAAALAMSEAADAAEAAETDFEDTDGEAPF